MWIEDKSLNLLINSDQIVSIFVDCQDGTYINADPEYYFINACGFKVGRYKTKQLAVSVLVNLSTALARGDNYFCIPEYAVPDDWQKYTE